MKKKEIIRIRKSTKNRQHNGQQKRDKRTNIYLQNITQRTKDRAIRAPLKTGNELRCSGRVSSSILYLVFLMHIIIRFHFHCLLRMLSFLSPVQNLFMDSFTGVGITIIRNITKLSKPLHTSILVYIYQ